MKHSCKLFGFLTLLLFFSACTNLQVRNHKQQTEAPWLKPGILNSQRIEAKFGSYGVEQLLKANPELRFSNLFSLNDGVKYARTIALTHYKPRDQRLIPAHNEIMAGGSIGSVLVKHGFSIKKDIFFVEEIGDLPSLVGELMHTDNAKYAAIIYDLNVEKDAQLLPYCTILEVYHPGFLTLDEVKQIYKPTTTSNVVENIAIKTDKRAESMIRTLREVMPSL